MKNIIGKPREIATMLFTLEQDKEYELKEYKPIRGLRANAYFHKLINELAKYNRSIGYAISDDEMKININLSYGTIAKDENGNIVGAMVPKGTSMQSFYPYAKWYKSTDTCDCYYFYKRTHELNSKEFWQLIKGLERECKDVGIATLDDLEFERMMREYEKEYSKSKRISK